jgi:hypothetical protein
MAGAGQHNYGPMGDVKKMTTHLGGRDVLRTLKDVGFESWTDASSHHHIALRDRSGVYGDEIRVWGTPKGDQDKALRNELKSKYPAIYDEHFSKFQRDQLELYRELASINDVQQFLEGLVVETDSGSVAPFAGQVVIDDGKVLIESPWASYALPTGAAQPAFVEMKWPLNGIRDSGIAAMQQLGIDLTLTSDEAAAHFQAFAGAQHALAHWMELTNSGHGYGKGTAAALQEATQVLHNAGIGW